MISEEKQIEYGKYLANGYTATEIADMLLISRRTVEGHIDLMKLKFNAKNIVNLVAILLRKNLIK